MCRVSRWLAASGTAKEAAVLKSASLTMRKTPQTSCRSWRWCWVRGAGSSETPSQMRKQMSCRKQTSDSTSKSWDGHQTPSFLTAGTVSPDSARWLSFSVYEKDNDLVVQEIATRPLTQDLLQHEVRESLQPLQREKNAVGCFIFSWAPVSMGYPISWKLSALPSLRFIRCPLKTGQLGPTTASVARGRWCVEAALTRDGKSTLSTKDDVSLAIRAKESCGPGINSGWK